MKYFLLFCGYPRSGHTLTASILNANPNVYCSNQLNIFSWVSPDIDRGQFLTRLKAWSTQRHTWKQTTLIPHMPKRDIRVIGDKTGHRTVELLRDDYEKLEVVKSVVQVPIKWIHVVRNPFDNCATWAKLNYDNLVKNGKHKGTTQHRELDKVIHKYRDLNSTIKRLRRREEVLTVNHEFLITRMHNTLEEISNYLEIDFDPDWRENVKKTVWKKPRITRNSIKWSQPQKNAVKRLIDKYEWLKGYEFGGGCGKC